MEEAVKAFAQEAGLTLPIRGKAKALFSRLYELIRPWSGSTIATFFGVDYTPPTQLELSDSARNPARPPNLCAGCSHRATFTPSKKRAEGMDTIPRRHRLLHPRASSALSMGDFLICMGSSVSSLLRLCKGHRPKRWSPLSATVHLFPFRHDRPGQCRLQQSQFHPGDPGQRHSQP
jgi:indolepyruvate ferredoxin oxidoreductase alpha subunit